MSLKPPNDAATRTSRLPTPVAGGGSSGALLLLDGTVIAGDTLTRIGAERGLSVMTPLVVVKAATSSVCWPGVIGGSRAEH